MGTTCPHRFFLGANRTSTNPNHKVGDFDVSFYFGTFTGADGTDVAASTTLIGVGQSFAEGLNLPGIASGANATSSAFSHAVSFAGSGISNGDAVWVRLSDGANASGLDEPYFDNLSVTIVPAPSSALLLLLGTGFLVRRRR